MEWKWKSLLEIAASLVFVLLLIAVSSPPSLLSSPLSLATEVTIFSNDFTKMFVNVVIGFVYVVLCAIVIDHVNHLNAPAEQIPILCVVSMPTFCTLMGLLTLRLTPTNYILISLFESIPEIYGCFVLGMLLCLMLINLHIPCFFLRGTDTLKTKHIILHWPLSYFLPKQIDLNDKNIQYVKGVVWQAFFVRLLGSAVVMMLQSCGFDHNYIGLSFAVIYFCSSVAAVLAVSYFYDAVASDSMLLNPRKQCFWTKGCLSFVFYLDKVFYLFGLSRVSRCLFMVSGMLLLSFLNFQLFPAAPYYKAPDIECVSDKVTSKEGGQEDDSSEHHD